LERDISRPIGIASRPLLEAASVKQAVIQYGGI
jgi:hypothetical protein